ncbi:MAG: DUF4382 domain-containing protein [Candidatus Binatia bacterium]
MARRSRQKVTGIYPALLQFILAVFLATIPGNAAQKTQGVLEIRVKDHREAIGDFSKLMLTVDKVAVSPKPGLMFWRAGWQDLVPAVDSVDLTHYIGGKSARVFRAGLDPEAFDAIHLKLKSVDGILKKSHTKVPIKNMVGPVKLAFEVRPQSETLIVLDLVVLDMSDHPPRAYELAIRGYELYTNGKLVDKIPPGP